MDKWQRIKFQPNLPLGNKGERVTASIEHTSLSKNAAKEGMVLLKNEGNTLPLAEGSKVALFGKATFDYVKGGGGSGDVTVEYITNLYEGFKKLDFNISVYEELATFYREYVAGEYKAGKEPGLMSEPSLPKGLLNKAIAYTDTAVISLCRFSGEGWDRSSGASNGEVYAEPWVGEYTIQSNALFEEGDFYISLAERALINTVKKSFKKVIIVMNVGGMVASDWFIDDEEINSVLMAWQAGMEGGQAMAELLCGMGNPSGKLVDTFAKRLEDYPSTYNFHESRNYVEYTDDIYVGYRYFETVPGAYEKVNYPFGFGLSYTTFDWEYQKILIDGQGFKIEAQVTNTGKLSGREVLQVYSIPPQGLLGKPAKALVAFKKTRLLMPGESQKLELTFDQYDMASYDDAGKVSQSSYLLEKGDYQFFLGTSVRDGKVIDYTYKVEQDRVIEQVSQKIAPTSLPKRLLADGSYEKLQVSEANDHKATILDKKSPEELDGLEPMVRGRERAFRMGPKDQAVLMDVVEGKTSLDDLVGLMSDDELAHLLGGQPNVGVANTWGFGNLAKYEIPNVMTADGPAGVRINKECGINTTAWPCATLLACTWDDDLVYDIGRAGSKEVKENNLGIWLTPAINIHRSPLCGRNFEYYSEDPLVTGKLAAAMVRGIQSQGISASVKHFALNNKETNRKDSDSRVSERAAREIYLKAFEIVVKEADPWSIMSSYNIINGHRASENKELLEDILRGEWGFKGAVTTDWWTWGEHYKEVMAGNDVKMACGWPERLLKANETGVLSREEMERSVKRILELIIKLD